MKALGFELSTRGLVQVSMNLVNYGETGMHQAYDAVRREADKLGVEIVSTEIVGLVPENALDKDAEYFQKVGKFHGGQDSGIAHADVRRFVESHLETELPAPLLRPGGRKT